MLQHDKIRLATLLQLARNDLRSRYSSSVLGILWAFVMPLTTIIVFWFVFQMGFRNPPIGDAPYILWFCSAYIPWIFFTDLMTNGSGCLVEYSYLVKKIRFQVAVIPLVKLLSAAIIHLFFVVLLCLMCAVYDLGVHFAMIQMLYYSFAAGVLGLGLMYLLCALTVFFKDTASIVNIIVQIGFWVTPIMWNEQTMPDGMVRKILALNPMHYVITGYRSCILDDVWFWENPVETLGFWAFTMVLLLTGLVFFRKLRPFFADEV